MSVLSFVYAIPAMVIFFYLSVINAHLLPLQTAELVPIVLQGAFFGFLAGTMYGFTDKRLAIIGMLTSFVLLVAGFLGDETVNIYFNIAPNAAILLNFRIACIVLGALGAIRCWYGFRKPTEELGKAETALEFMDKFFN